MAEDDGVGPARDDGRAQGARSGAQRRAHRVGVVRRDEDAALVDERERVQLGRTRRWQHAGARLESRGDGPMLPRMKRELRRGESAPDERVHQVVPASGARGHPALERDPAVVERRGVDGSLPAPARDRSREANRRLALEDAVEVRRGGERVERAESRRSSLEGPQQVAAAEKAGIERSRTADTDQGSHGIEGRVAALPYSPRSNPMTGPMKTGVPLATVSAGVVYEAGTLPTSPRPV